MVLGFTAEKLGWASGSLDFAVRVGGGGIVFCCWFSFGLAATRCCPDVPVRGITSRRSAEEDGPAAAGKRFEQIYECSRDKEWRWSFVWFDVVGFVTF